LRALTVRTIRLEDVPDAIVAMDDPIPAAAGVTVATLPPR